MFWGKKKGIGWWWWGESRRRVHWPSWLQPKKKVGDSTRRLPKSTRLTKKPKKKKNHQKLFLFPPAVPYPFLSVTVPTTVSNLGGGYHSEEKSPQHTHTHTTPLSHCIYLLGRVKLTVHGTKNVSLRRGYAGLSHDYGTTSFSLSFLPWLVSYPTSVTRRKIYWENDWMSPVIHGWKVQCHLPAGRGHVLIACQNVIELMLAVFLVADISIFRCTGFQYILKDRAGLVFIEGWTSRRYSIPIGHYCRYLQSTWGTWSITRKSAM